MSNFPTKDSITGITYVASYLRGNEIYKAYVEANSFDEACAYVSARYDPQVVFAIVDMTSEEPAFS